MTYPFWQRFRTWFLRLGDNTLPLFVVVLFTTATGLLTLLLHTLASWLTGLPSPTAPGSFLAGLLIVRNVVTAFLLFNALFLPLTLPLSLLLWHLSERVGWWLQEVVDRHEREV